MNAKMNLMKKFMNDRKHLKSFQSITYHDHETRPYIYIDRPEVLAGFAGYLKYQCLMYGFGPKVFCRGQINDYPSIPSLFRDDKHSQLTNDRIRVRWNAYKDLVSKTPSLYKASRFKDEDIDPIFQHYGLKTPWLDLVDNVFIALWFATKKYDTDKMGMARYTTSRQKYGRIYFYAINKETKYYDLRERHSSLTLRLHVQHGISMTRNTAEWNILNRNLDDYLIATVKFPNNKNWRPNGYIFSTKFLFPSDDLDNTYKYLKKNKFGDLLSEIRTKYNLDGDELGSVTNFG